MHERRQTSFIWNSKSIKLEKIKKNRKLISYCLGQYDGSNWLQLVSRNFLRWCWHGTYICQNLLIFTIKMCASIKIINKKKDFTYLINKTPLLFKTFFLNVFFHKYFSVQSSTLSGLCLSHVREWALRCNPSFNLFISGALFYSSRVYSKVLVIKYEL